MEQSNIPGISGAIGAAAVILGGPAVGLALTLLGLVTFTAVHCVRAIRGFQSL
jgi:hypothetical protein